VADGLRKLERYKTRVRGEPGEVKAGRHAGRHAGRQVVMVVVVVVVVVVMVV